MLEIRPLRPADDRQRFNSGDADLDRFLRKYAGQNQFRLHVGTTYVAVEDAEILGYVTLAATSIAVEGLPARQRKRLPAYPLPALRVARLAVDQSIQRQGIGSQLLRATFRIAHEMAKTVGCVGVVVDAIPAAISFYKRYGFEPLEVLEGQLPDRPAPQPLFLPLGSIVHD